MPSVPNNPNPVITLDDPSTYYDGFTQLFTRVDGNTTGTNPPTVTIQATNATIAAVGEKPAASRQITMQYGSFAVRLDINASHWFVTGERAGVNDN